MLTSSMAAASLPSGYYDNVTVTADPSIVEDGTVTYTLVHQHVGDEVNGGGCYGNPVEKQVGTESVGHDYYYDGPAADYICRRCRAHKQATWNNGVCYSKPVYATFYETNCGYEKGDYVRETQDYDSIAATEYVKSMEIVFE